MIGSIMSGKKHENAKNQRKRPFDMFWTDFIKGGNKIIVSNEINPKIST